jgi:D-sedoheptulose 7-phosphate isomerase
MRNQAKEYYSALARLIGEVEATTGAGGKEDFHLMLERAGEMIVAQCRAGRKLMFIGNGASASIASHMAADFCKNAGLRAVVFNDHALLTSISNDFDYTVVFEKPISLFADTGDILVAISSSGMSPNILKGAAIAKEKGCKVISLSGFSPDNKLRGMGDVNFFVPSPKYGTVEVVHHSICHCILDGIINKYGNLSQEGDKPR